MKQIFLLVCFVVVAVVVVGVLLCCPGLPSTHPLPSFCSSTPSSRAYRLMAWLWSWTVAHSKLIAAAHTSLVPCPCSSWSEDKPREAVPLTLKLQWYPVQQTPTCVREFPPFLFTLTKQNNPKANSTQNWEFEETRVLGLFSLLHNWALMEQFFSLMFSYLKMKSGISALLYSYKVLYWNFIRHTFKYTIFSIRE